MYYTNLTIALLAAGISLAMGLISLFSGLHRNGEKTDVLFGIMCLSLFLFFFIPPQGFVLVDRAPYPAQIIIKRIFNFGFGALFPWFVFYYTRYKERKFPWVISVLWTISFLMMVFSSEESDKPAWVMFVLIPLGLACIHGFVAVRYQVHQGEKKKARWLQFALFIYLILYVVSAAYQLSTPLFHSLLKTKIFFPINLFPLAFIAIMGIRLRAHSIQKFQLEKTLDNTNMRWESLLKHMQMIAVHIDMNGVLTYINPFGLKLLQFNQSAEVVGKNWFGYFLPGPDKGIMQDVFHKAILTKESSPVYKNTIITREGQEKTISWVNELQFDDEGSVTGMICFGTDITDQELAFQKIQLLKSELEKENLLLKGEPLPAWMQEEIIGTSEAITYAIQKAKKVAETQASVLLQGETGSGKELFADLIQRSSLRHNKPFVKVNCGALPADLIEDELFGHEKGAFTGAVQVRKGRFEIADGGTIFLDEIGELPLALQPKLLRVLQNGEFERIGGQQTLKIDVRIIAATNRELQSAVNEGIFRSDLFYRLNVYPITIPPLRQRKEDIPMLIQFFIDKLSRKHNKEFNNISKADFQQLSNYSWPGNIRELINVIERSVIGSDHQTLRLDLLSIIAQDKKVHKAPLSLEEIEKEHILKVLLDSNWRISGEGGAAEKLIMNPNTLRSRMKKLNIVRSSGQEPA